MTITDTVTVTNSSYQGGPLLLNLPDIGNGQGVGAGEGVTLVSQTDPADLTHGEVVYHCVPNSCSLPNGVAPTTYALEDLNVGTPYTFVTVVHVANPLPGQKSAGPWSWVPTVIVSVQASAKCISGASDFTGV